MRDGESYDALLASPPNVLKDWLDESKPFIVLTHQTADGVQGPRAARSYTYAGQALCKSIRKTLKPEINHSRVFRARDARIVRIRSRHVDEGRSIDQVPRCWSASLNHGAL